MGAVSVVSLAGCSSESEPCSGVSIGTRYELVVGTVAPGKPAVAQQCADDWGFAEGNVFEAQIVRLGNTEGEACRAGIPTLSGNGGWAFELNSRQYTQGSVLLEGQYTTASGSCKGVAFLDVGCDGSCQYSAEPCACQFVLYLGGTEVGCPPVCNVATTGTVSKL